MVSKDGTGATTRRKSSPVNYFYLTVPVNREGDTQTLLHKKLHINRGLDEITTWCYPLHKRVTYTYSTTRRRMKPAFTMAEAGRLLNRRRHALEDAILDGKIEPPQYTYGLNPAKKKYKYMFSEENVLDAHDYFSTVHVGRPRKDGLVTPKKLPTRRELLAMLRNSEILYVKVGEEFLPTWDAPDI